MLTFLRYLTPWITFAYITAAAVVWSFDPGVWHWTLRASVITTGVIGATCGVLSHSPHAETKAHTWRVHFLPSHRNPTH